MAEEQRKLLEQLMGDSLKGRPGRGGGLKKMPTMNLYDRKICKSYLVGTCPHDLFTSTKQDLGPCPKQHMQKHKMEYQFQLSKGKEFPEFDYEYEKDLEKYIVECTRRTEAALKKLEKTPEDMQKIAAMNQEIEQIDISMALTLQEIEKLGEKGEITMAVQLYYLLQQKRVDKEAKQRELRLLADVGGGPSGHQKLQVCEVCGAYLSRLDNDRRLADHFMGKMHLGYVQMRQAYKAIKEKNRARQNSRGSTSNHQSGGYSHGGYSERRRERR